MKIVVWATTSVRMGAAGTANNIQFPFEVEADSLEHLYDRLRCDGAVIGDKLQLRHVDPPQPGVREIVSRQPTILTLAGLAMLQHQRGRVIEVELVHEVV